jgi:hypothetical protein
MSRPGIGLAPDTQAQTSKVAPANEIGQTPSPGYQKGVKGMFQTAQPKAPTLAPGTGGSRGTGGRGREAQNVGKYTPPKWP